MISGWLGLGAKGGCGEWGVTANSYEDYYRVAKML